MTIRMKEPSHPGAFTREMVIKPLGLSVSAAAKALGITKPTLSNFLNEKAPLSPDMAIRLDKVFGVDMETLIRMQASHNIAEAKKNKGKINVSPYKVLQDALIAGESSGSPAPFDDRAFMQKMHTKYLK